MVKSLVGKAIVPVALAVTGFVIVCCILLYSVLKADMTDTAILHASSLAEVVVKSTRYAMLKSDRETLGNIIDNIGEQHDVEHVRIFNKKGLIEFSANRGEVNRIVDKTTAGCIGCHAGPVPTAKLGAMQQARQFENEQGRAVLAITAPIYNEPECYTAACHFHTANQKVLGTLDIGLSRQPLQKALSTMRSRMIAFSIFILFITVGGVAALLRRMILVPVKNLAEYCDELEQGNYSAEIPRCEGELEKLAQALKKIAVKMKNLER
jgi:HAMP domain-containing protein